MIKKDLFGKALVKPNLIERDVLTKVFVETMKDSSEEELASMIYSKFEAILDFAKLCSGKRAGERISLLFNPHRLSIRTITSISTVDAFKDEKYLSGLARLTLYKEKEKNKEILYKCIELGANGIQYVNEFPPFVARNIYKSYSAKKILDPCAGWGGRMIGAASLGLFYHAFEPATKTFEGLQKLGEFLKSFNNGFDFKIEKLPFEDAKLKGKYDLAFTSPPYYDTEHYSDEKTNSCNRYKTFKEWKKGFYFPLINKALKHSNNFILNVGSRKYDRKKPLFSRYETKEIPTFLSGKSGLGRKKEGKESFYLVIKKKDKEKKNVC